MANWPIRSLQLESKFRPLRRTRPSPSCQKYRYMLNQHETSVWVAVVLGSEILTPFSTSFSDSTWPNVVSWPFWRYLRPYCTILDGKFWRLRSLERLRAQNRATWISNSNFSFLKWLRIFVQSPCSKIVGQLRLCTLYHLGSIGTKNLNCLSL